MIYLLIKSKEDRYKTRKVTVSKYGDRKGSIFTSISRSNAGLQTYRPLISRLSKKCHTYITAHTGVKLLLTYNTIIPSKEILAKVFENKKNDIELF